MAQKSFDTPFLGVSVFTEGGNHPARLAHTVLLVSLTSPSGRQQLVEVDAAESPGSFRGLALRLWALEHWLKWYVSGLSSCGGGCIECEAMGPTPADGRGRHLAQTVYIYLPTSCYAALTPDAFRSFSLTPNQSPPPRFVIVPTKPTLGSPESPSECLYTLLPVPWLLHRLTEYSKAPIPPEDTGSGRRNITQALEYPAINLLPPSP
ncbi:hypothetical protein BKA70DRAFT_1403292 [Coprinopsis sp. MPI-PUGE-AT-0042]|nr:hypothetical protein BKA70DRAFT_1403292 [Coprinopsis sp. MPI-PUGE-AT-0042]